MKKILGLLVVAVLVLAGCGASSDVAEGEVGGKLTIAAEGDAYNQYFTEVGAQFSEETGVEIEVVDASMIDTLEALPTQKGNGPDLMLAPNDRIGILADQKLIAPLETSVTEYTENSINAGTYNEQQYLLPLSTETTLLIYNKDKLTEAPATLEDLGAENLLAKFTDFYITAGLFYDQGGYVFGAENTDPTDVGINNEGSVKAGEIVKELYGSGNENWSLMSDDAVAYDVMMEAFTTGDVAAIINGPWALKDITDAGINYGIAVIPSWDGTGTYAPLVGTKGLVTNAYSSNAASAQAFVDFLNSSENANKWVEITKEVSPNNGVTYEAGSESAIILEATKVGTPMPTDPAFGKVWEPMKDSLLQIAAQEDVKASLDAAKEAIDTGVAGMQ